MKRSILASAALLCSAAMLVACGNSSSPAHDGIYETKTSLASASAWDKTLGNATGLLNKKVSFTYSEKTKVSVDAHGGTSDFSKFTVDVTATTTGYIDFSATDFYAYVKTEYKDANNASTNYVKEGLIKKDADNHYKALVTESTDWTDLTESVYAAFGSVFTLVSTVANTKASHIDSTAFILGDDAQAWLYQVVGLSSAANSGLEDWKDTVVNYGTNESDELVLKAVAPVIGYTTDQGVSDFGYSTGDVADVYAKVGVEGYLNAWDVDLRSDKASLDFAIMSPAPTVTINGNRSFRADYNATAQEHKSTIDHAEPEPTPVAKYATWSVVADNGVKSFTMNRMVLEGYNATGIKEITWNGKDEIVDNLWFCVKLNLNADVTVTSVKVNGVDATPVSGMYCIAVSEETNYEFTVVTSSAETTTKATLLTVGDSNVTAVTEKYCLVSNPTNMMDIPSDGVDPSAVTYFVVKPTLADGKEVDVVLCNGVDITATAKQMGGFYGVKAGAAGFYQITILTK